MGKCLGRKNKKGERKKMNKEFLTTSISGSSSLLEAELNFLEALKYIKEQSPDLLIYYLIGTVTSDGPEYIERNLQLLKERSQKAGEVLDGIVFSAADIFNQQLFDRFDKRGAVNQDYLDFWEDILKSGFITDIIRASGWEKSMGASHENKIASQEGIAIHDYSDFVTE